MGSRPNIAAYCERKRVRLRTLRVAMTVAMFVVVIELGTISFVRHKYMDTPFLQAAFQVVVGGVLVFLTGILIGSS